MPETSHAIVVPPRQKRLKRMNVRVIAKPPFFRVVRASIELRKRAHLRMMCSEIAGLLSILDESKGPTSVWRRNRLYDWLRGHGKVKAALSDGYVITKL